MINKILAAALVLFLMALLGWCSPRCTPGPVPSVGKPLRPEAPVFPGRPAPAIDASVDSPEPTSITPEPPESALEQPRAPTADVEAALSASDEVRPRAAESASAPDAEMKTAEPARPSETPPSSAEDNHTPPVESTPNDAQPEADETVKAEPTAPAPPDATDTTDTTDTTDAPADAPQASQTIVLEGVHFRIGSSRLTRASLKPLDKAAADLKAKPDLSVEIAGYTDNTGNPAHNLRLSQQRAETVRRYFINKGVDPARLTAKGYGSASPVASNDTREGRLMNRRVELHIQ
ncbi:MAG TPA: OmpA family protein [Gammaproteobacteria bacterium]|nr:OmpA family protein [Gammaproteobacteria bacterium]